MKLKILIVTGLSGSGKSVALRALEDSGYHCIDNLPPDLIDPLAQPKSGASPFRNLAIGIDIREPEFLPSIDSLLPPWREKYDLEVVFFEAEAEVLLRRFKETRRPHPLIEQGMAVQDAIALEVRTLQPLRLAADRVIDTSQYTPHQLRNHITCLFGEHECGDAFAITLISFGYKFGIPQNADLLFDVRFVPNPYFVPELRDLKGTDPQVRDFTLGTWEAEGFLQRLEGFLDFLIPLYRAEGRAYLTIGIGCTGGRHRSPAIIEQMAQNMAKRSIAANVVHRDI